MKKLVLLFSALLVAIVVLNVNLNVLSKSNNIDLQNVEALASGEGSDVKCISIGSIDCPTSNAKVLFVIQ